MKKLSNKEIDELQTAIFNLSTEPGLSDKEIDRLMVKYEELQKQKESK